MHQELRLHGHIDDTIEYYAAVAARDAERCHFYERDGDVLRVFSPGNEIRLDRTGLSHWGNGGSFCEYMYGIDQPLADLLKPEVRNRLVFFGAGYREGGELLFSDDTMGRIPYDTIFEEGHAISNYFFFVTGSIYGALKTQQEGLLCLLGKLLKRTARVSDPNDSRLIDELIGLLGHKSHIYLVRLINKKHQAYYDLFRQLYFVYRAIPDDEYDRLSVLAERLGIDERQQQRIRISVMYAHRENRRVVDEYRAILTSCHHNGIVRRHENARLTRLKTLATRNKIPAELFVPLDEHLKYEKLVDQEQDYICETREILSGLLSTSDQADLAITGEDMVRLLFAKRQAMRNRDYLFDQVLLETSKACDEKVHAGADVALLEKITSVIDYFDHYETSAMEINNLAFMVGVRIEEQMLYQLRRSYTLLQRLQDNLFETLLFDDLLKNKFLGMYGRQKILCLQALLKNKGAIPEMVVSLREISANEVMYDRLLQIVKEQLRNKYSRAVNWEDHVVLKQEVEMILIRQGLLNGPFPDALFRDVMINLETELFYLQEFLPTIVAENNIELREDFLLNSGLDRFYVEEIENDYLQRHGLNADTLSDVRKGVE